MTGFTAIKIQDCTSGVGICFVKLAVRVSINLTVPLILAIAIRLYVQQFVPQNAAAVSAPRFWMAGLVSCFPNYNYTFEFNISLVGVALKLKVYGII
ncbi:hypothetical protein Q3G72_010009 [Acer saccharum]|nr:hypothetical protein Q3G72_010009 [Acer saccharum]